MPLFRKNIISNQVIKAKSDKIMKRALRDANKKIKRGELFDSHGLALYLQTIDARYASLKADIANASRVAKYSDLREQKLSDTSELLQFFDQDQEELAELAKIVKQKAHDAGRLDDLKQERRISVDLSKLNVRFDRLTREEKEDDR